MDFENRRSIGGITSPHLDEAELERTALKASGTPDSTWTVSQIKSYLDEHSISYSSSAKKSELLELVK
ncbi:HeH/LEM domain-containing protein [Atopobacter phocae]|uniref:HeH/LEM domain-containing protein n=1 Tax=Atopobacter phocae TaxID=136492 RepID=UPI0004B97E07|nr:HeH/LEM domain-containing protein [Atopobacter phocae]